MTTNELVEGRSALRPLLCPLDITIQNSNFPTVERKLPSAPRKYAARHTPSQPALAGLLDVARCFSAGRSRAPVSLHQPIVHPKASTEPRHYEQPKPSRLQPGSSFSPGVYARVITCAQNLKPKTYSPTPEPRCRLRPTTHTAVLGWLINARGTRQLG